MDNTKIPEDVMSLFKTTGYDKIMYIGDYNKSKVFNLGMEKTRDIPLVLIIKDIRRTYLVRDSDALKYIRYFNAQNFRRNLHSLIYHQS